MSDRFQFHSASELASGKVDAASWIAKGGTTHELELGLQRAEPQPPLYRITYSVSAPDGTVIDRSYLHDDLTAAHRQYATIRLRSPIPK
jgi:hypothetical protein